MNGESTLVRKGAVAGGFCLTTEAWEKLKACCRDTIMLHGEHNPMMVCADCKNTIKCFTDEKSYNNYIKFCHSRGRRVLNFQDGERFFVMYHP